MGFFAKLYPKNLGLAGMPDLRVIFIILIIKLNLHNPSLSKPGCKTGLKNIGCGSRYKVVSYKCDNKIDWLKKTKKINKKEKINEEKEKKLN